MTRPLGRKRSASGVRHAGGGDSTVRVRAPKMYVRADGRWDRRKYVVVLCSSKTARRDLLDSAHVAVPPRDARGVFRLEDGHLREFQPRASRIEAEAWLASNPNGFAVLLDSDGGDR